MNNPPPSVPVAMLLGYLLIWSVFAIFLLAIAHRKGRSRWVAIIGFVPMVGAFYALWLVSLTDKAVLDRINALETKLPPRIPGT
jgi:hypothetical protein